MIIITWLAFVYNIFLFLVWVYGAIQGENPTERKTGLIGVLLTLVTLISILTLLLRI